jgi:hypothetical protein
MVLKILAIFAFSINVSPTFRLHPTFYPQKGRVNMAANSSVGDTSFEKQDIFYVTLAVKGQEEQVPAWRKKVRCVSTSTVGDDISRPRHACNAQRERSHTIWRNCSNAGLGTVGDEATRQLGTLSCNINSRRFSRQNVSSFANNMVGSKP